jgi:hypothetical protein
MLAAARTSELFDRLRVNFAERKRNADAKAEHMLAISVIDIRDMELLAEDAEIIERIKEHDEDGTFNDVPVSFNDDTGMVRWDNGNTRLPAILYKFLKTVLYAEDKQMDESDIESIVWGDKGASTNTLHSAARLLRKTLKDEKFPYVLESIYTTDGEEGDEECSPKTGRVVANRWVAEIKGYRVRLQ